MHKKRILFPMISIICLLACACASSVEKNDNVSLSVSFSVSFADVKSKVWYLNEVETNTGSFEIDRTSSIGNFSNYFTLIFDEDTLNGIGAPNRFFGPYSADENEISIGHLAGTLMAAIIEPENLKEHEYIAYLERANYWNLANGKLELSTTDKDGLEVILKFEEK